MKDINEVIRELPSVRQDRIKRRVSELLKDPEIRAALYRCPEAQGDQSLPKIRRPEPEA